MLPTQMQTNSSALVSFDSFVVSALYIIAPIAYVFFVFGPCFVMYT